VLAAGIGGALLLATRNRLAERAQPLLAAGALVVVLAGPAAYPLQTAATPHTGAVVTAGPDITMVTGPGNSPGQAPGGGQLPEGTAAAGTTQGGPGGPAATSVGGLLNDSTPGTKLVTLLEEDARSYTWVAATVGANSAAGYQLATGDPVLAIGGFNGSDPSPTLARFEQDVAESRIHYFIAVGQGSGSGSGTAQQIATWVAEHFTATTVDGVTIYDLTASTATT
jgi:hypothetical protein